MMRSKRRMHVICKTSYFCQERSIGTALTVLMVRSNRRMCFWFSGLVYSTEVCPAPNRFTCTRNEKRALGEKLSRRDASADCSVQHGGVPSSEEVHLQCRD